MRIPQHAKLAFKGVIFDVYQWEQKMFDGSTATFEMLKRPNTVLVVPVVNEKILISEQEQPDKPPYVSLLGGRQDEGEEPLETAKRELLEEAGMEASSLELWKVYEPFSKMDWKIYVYIAKECKKVSEQNLDAGEKIVLKEASFEEFMHVLTQEGFWGGEFSLDLLKMERNNELDTFKQKLFTM